MGRQGDNEARHLVSTFPVFHFYFHFHFLHTHTHSFDPSVLISGVVFFCLHFPLIPFYCFFSLSFSKAHFFSFSFIHPLQGSTAGDDGAPRRGGPLEHPQALHGQGPVEDYHPGGVQ